MPDVDCDKVESDLDALQKKIDSGLEQEKEFQEDFAQEIGDFEKEDEELEDHISIEDQDDVDYEDLENEIDRKKSGLEELKTELGDLEREWEELLDKREPIASLMTSNELLIDDYRLEIGLLDCDVEPNKSTSPQCVSLNDILAALEEEQSNLQLDIDAIDARLLAIPGDVARKEDDIATEEQEVSDLETELSFQERQEAHERQRQYLDDVKRTQYPDAHNLQENQATKDELLDEMFEHCMDQPGSGASGAGAD